MVLEERQHAIVQNLGRGDRRLAIVELGEGDLGVGVDEGLLVDTAHTLHVADVEGVLGAAIARVLALEFAMGLLLGLGFFQRDDLSWALLASSALSRFFMVSRS